MGSKKTYTPLQLIADEKRRIISDTIEEGDLYSGFVEEEIYDLKIEGLLLNDPVELSPEHVKYPESDTVYVDFPVEEGDELYLVVVRYSDGGTFSRTTGYHCLVGAFKTKTEARECEAAVKENKWGRYAPWVGYFASFEGVEIEKVMISCRR